MNDRIPIVIGVTGHRNIPAEYTAALYEKARAFLDGLRRRYPHTEIIVLSALAIGADTICARAALDSGCTLIAPLPMGKKAYRTDFLAGDEAVFERLCGAAKYCFAVTSETAAAPRSSYYRESGKYIKEHSHLLLALWDGDGREVRDGGTSDIVRMAARGDPAEQAVPLRESEKIPVFHIVTPKAGKPLPDEPLSAFFIPAGGAAQPCDTFPAVGFFEDAEQFNTDVIANKALIRGGAKASLAACLNGETLPGPPERFGDLPGVFAAADVLANICRRKRNGAVRNLSLIALFLVFFFLVYAEASVYLSLALYALLLIPAFLIHRGSKKGKWHERYMLYRTLAETLRVQLYLRIAGDENRVRIAEWRRERALDFVQGAVLPFLIPPFHAEGGPEIAERCWVEGQLRYHLRSKQGKGRSHLTHESAARFLMFAAIVFCAAALFYEGLFPREMEEVLANLSFIPISPAAMLTLSDLFKLALGLLFAGAAFLSNYYGKLSLPEQIANDEKM
ncbi:MAG: hypothetical protein LBS85_04470, partial [Clostridiales Family XIII bacterium]|nr:hypothetical protein [Clostridiales Family XIII bacterium]